MVEQSRQRFGGILAPETLQKLDGCDDAVRVGAAQGFRKDGKAGGILDFAPSGDFLFQG